MLWGTVPFGTVPFGTVPFGMAPIGMAPIGVAPFGTAPKSGRPPIAGLVPPPLVPLRSEPTSDRPGNGPGSAGVALGGSSPRRAPSDPEPGRSAAATIEFGSSTIAEVPPYGERRSVTLTWCLAASRATTNRPSWLLSARSNSGAWARSSL